MRRWRSISTEGRKDREGARFREAPVLPETPIQRAVSFVIEDYLIGRGSKGDEHPAINGLRNLQLPRSSRYEELAGVSSSRRMAFGTFFRRSLRRPGVKRSARSRRADSAIEVLLDGVCSRSV